MLKIIFLLLAEYAAIFEYKRIKKKPTVFAVGFKVVCSGVSR